MKRMAETLGSILKRARMARHLTQQVVADDICSQPLPSAIENGRYTPNADLLIALCQRLGIDLNSLQLADNYAVGTATQFNQTVEKLCNQHQYTDLLKFLKQDDVISAIQSDTQTQAYYYYLSVATFQASDSPDLAQIKQILKLALASAPESQSILTRLIQITLALVSALGRHADQATKWLAKATEQIDQTPFEPNVTVIYYLSALTQFNLGQDVKSAASAARGLEVAAAHDSHYLFANVYYLLAILAHRNDQADKQQLAEQRSVTFSELFKEPVYKPDH